MYMQRGSVNTDYDWQKKLTKAPRGLKGKALSMQELDRYLSVNSIRELIYVLVQFRINDYFTYKVMLSGEYLEWERAQNYDTYGMGRLKPMEGLLSIERAPYAMISLSGKSVPYDTELSESQLHLVLTTLPSYLQERYLRFKLDDINQKRLREIIAARPATNKLKMKVDNYYIDEHKGLVVGIADVAYKGEEIELDDQQRELLRVLVKNPGTTLPYERFYDDPEIFKSNRDHEDPKATVSKLIHATHKKLRPIVGECIFNKPKFGWKLKII